MNVKVHFATLIEVLMAAIEFGVDLAFAEGTQFGSRTAEHISSATLHAAHPLRDKSAQSSCGSH